jgi:hypothetical protein
LGSIGVGPEIIIEGSAGGDIHIEGAEVIVFGEKTKITVWSGSSCGGAGLVGYGDFIKD